MEKPEYSERTLGELGEVIQGTSYQIGRINGADGIAKDLMEQAGKAFAAQCNNEAHLLRRVASEIKDKADRQRAEWQSTYQLREQAAFSELDKREKNK